MVRENLSKEITFDHFVIDPNDKKKQAMHRLRRSVLQAEGIA